MTIRELKQRQRRQQRGMPPENVTLCFCKNFAVIQSHYACKICSTVTIPELNWNQRFWDNRTKLNICHHMLTSSTQLQNRSFHVIERTRKSSKCQEMKNTRAKHVKPLFFIVTYANLWRSCCHRRRGCLSSLLILIYHIYRIYSLIRRTLNFRRQLWQVSKMKISPKYPVIRRTQNYGKFCWPHRCTYNNLLPKVTNYVASIFKTIARVTHEQEHKSHTF